MSLSDPVDLGDIHSELSCILFAVRTEFRDVGGMLDFKICYTEATLLQVVCSYWGSSIQKKRITDILKLRFARGIVHTDYDYRFDGVSYSTHFSDYVEPHVLTANVRLYDRHRNGNHRKRRSTTGLERPQNAPRPPYEWPVPPPYQPPARKPI